MKRRENGEVYMGSRRDNGVVGRLKFNILVVGGRRDDEGKNGTGDKLESTLVWAVGNVGWYKLFQGGMSSGKCITWCKAGRSPQTFMNWKRPLTKAFTTYLMGGSRVDHNCLPSIHFSSIAPLLSCV